jgi:hypothetical protein
MVTLPACWSQGLQQQQQSLQQQQQQQQQQFRVEDPSMVRGCLKALLQPLCWQLVLCLRPSRWRAAVLQQQMQHLLLKQVLPSLHLQLQHRLLRQQKLRSLQLPMQSAIQQAAAMGSSCCQSSSLTAGQHLLVRQQLTGACLRL